MNRNLACAALIAALLLILTSCSPVDTPPAYTPDQGPSEDGQQGDGWDAPYTSTSLLRATRTLAPFGKSILMKNGTLVDVETQATYHLCADPLCTDEDHNRIGDCPVAAFYYAIDFVVPEYGTNGEMTVYFLSLDLLPHEEGLGWDYYCFWRYHAPTQTMERLSETFKPTGATWSYSPQENAIYYTRYTQSADDSGKTEIALHALDCNTGEDRFISLLPTHLVADAYIQGELVLSDMADNLYTIDIREQVPQLVTTGARGKLYDEYIYYYENIHTVTAYMPDELSGYTVRDAGGDQLQIEVGDLYRVAYDKPNAKPEPVAENISKTSGYRFDEHYLLVASGEPTYRSSALNEKSTYYRLDDPAAPGDAKLVNLFSPDNGVYYLIDLKTMERSTLTLSDYTLSSSIFSPRRGYLFANMASYDVDRIIKETNSLAFTENYGTLIYRRTGSDLTYDGIKLLTFQSQ